MTGEKQLPKQSYNAVLQIGLLALFLSVSAQAGDRPNVLWLSIEDSSTQLGAYGYEHAVTPNIDALAEAGVRFDRAYASAPVCAVARSSLITGIYSVAQGSQFMRTEIVLPDEIKAFPWYLRQAGYFTTNRKKTDYQFPIPDDVWDRNGDDHRDWEERADAAQPFFSVINFGGTHESRNIGDYEPDLFDPAELELPPYFPDTPKTRKYWASYYQNLNYADTWLGENLARLEQDGLAENTIVVFWSDHGVGFPRGKRWIYELGLNVPMIVYVPDKWREQFALSGPGSSSVELVNFIDFAPTMLSIAGIERPDYMQGRVILGPERESEPQYLFAHRDRMDERIDIIRTLIGKRYKYIRNFEYYKPHMQFQETAEIHAFNGITSEIRRLHETGAGSPVADWFFEYKPVEELYDLKEDPNELYDLAADPDYAGILGKMRSELRAMQSEIGDLGSIPESLLIRWREHYGSEYAIRTQAKSQVEEAWVVLDGMPDLTVEELVKHGASDNPAVRYWAAMGLGNRVADSARQADIHSGLSPLLHDPEVIVRIAAARGILLLEDSDEALKVLTDVILDPSLSWIDHLAAMLAVDLAGSRALPARELLKNAEFDKKYPRRVRDELLPRIETAPPRVPPLPRSPSAPNSASVNQTGES